MELTFNKVTLQASSFADEEQDDPLNWEIANFGRYTRTGTTFAFLRWGGGFGGSVLV